MMMMYSRQGGHQQPQSRSHQYQHQQQQQRRCQDWVPEKVMHDHLNHPHGPSSSSSLISSYSRPKPDSLKSFINASHSFSFGVGTAATDDHTTRRFVAAPQDIVAPVPFRGSSGVPPPPPPFNTSSFDDLRCTAEEIAHVFRSNNNIDHHHDHQVPLSRRDHEEDPLLLNPTPFKENNNDNNGSSSCRHSINVEPSTAMFLQKCLDLEDVDRHDEFPASLEAIINRGFDDHLHEFGFTHMGGGEHDDDTRLLQGKYGEEEEDNDVIVPSVAPSSFVSTKQPYTTACSNSTYGSIGAECGNHTKVNKKKKPTGTGHQVWEDRFKELVEYVKVYGNTLVPHGWNVNRRLASWVKRQRYQYKLKMDGKGNKSSLSDERIARLQSIGFVWSTHTEHWDAKLNELAIYAKFNGNCNVPSKYPPNRQLSIWVRCQRRQYKLYMQQKNKDITKEEEAAGKKKSSSPSSSSSMEAFYTTTNDKDRNKDGKEGTTTPTSSMTEERIQKLEAIGFEFNPRNLQLW